MEIEISEVRPAVKRISIEFEIAPLAVSAQAKSVPNHRAIG
jgi:hypothetical protein